MQIQPGKAYIIRTIEQYNEFIDKAIAQNCTIGNAPKYIVPLSIYNPVCIYYPEYTVPMDGEGLSCEINYISETVSSGVSYPKSLTVDMRSYSEYKDRKHTIYVLDRKISHRLKKPQLPNI